MLQKIKPLKVVKAVMEKIEKIGRKNKTILLNGQDGRGQKNQSDETATIELTSWKQIKYLPKFLSKKEKLVIRLALLVIVICLIAMSYMAVKANLVSKPAQGGVYTENTVGVPQYINPLYASIGEPDRDLTRLVFAGLVKFDENQNIMPDLAKDWFVDNNLTMYTFQLRTDVYWPDGKQFGSQDVIFTFDAIKNENYQSSIKTNWTGIDVKAIDDFTVQFILPQPFTSFLENVRVGILPAHLWSDILPANAKLAELNLKPVGLGPYAFDSFVKDKQGYIKSYSLKANKNYHLGRPYINQITLKFQPTFEMAVAGLKNRSADGLSFLPLNLKQSLGSRNDLNYYSLSLPQYTAIFFNQQKNNNLADKKMRRALSMAIDKKIIIDNILQGEAQMIDGPLLPGFPGYIESKPIIGPDVPKAKKLLEELGWQRKKIEIEPSKTDEAATTTDKQIEVKTENETISKYLFKGDDELQITLTLANQPQAMAVAELIQKMWQSIGVKVNLNIVEANQIQKNIVNTREFEALLFGEILGVNPDLYPFWHSSQAENGGLNLANFKNTQADSLLEKIRKESSAEKKTEYYSKFDQILRDEIPAIFLYNPNYTYVVSNKIKGIQLKRIVSPADRFNNVAKWYIKTKKGFK